MDITAIAIVAILVGLCIEYFKYKTRIKKIEMESASGDGSNQADEIAKIKERIANLEKIVTDKGYQLSREIEAL